MNRIHIPLALGLAILLNHHCSAQQQNCPGISKTKPKSGRFVRYQNQFMVPYTFRIPGTKAEIEMLPVPAGTYLLNQRTRSGKNQTVEVKVQPFWMAKTETTWEQFSLFMTLDTPFRKFRSLKIRQVNENNKADAIAAPSAIYDMDFRRQNSGGSKTHPAATMSQFGARSYTKFLTKLTGESYRLPTAVEWRYAAMASVQPYQPQRFSEKELRKIAWFEVNTEIRNPVAKKKPNPWGFHDLLGNVAEWVLDGEIYNEELFEQTTISSLDAVAWPEKRHGRLALGGSFFDSIADCQIDSHKVSSEKLWDLDPNIPISPHWTASDDSQGIGFRIVRPYSPVKSKKLAAKYWEPDHIDLRDEIRSALDSRGSVLMGVVDKSLPAALKKLAAEK